MHTVADTRQSFRRLVKYQGVGCEYSQVLSGAHGSRHKAKLQETVKYQGVGCEYSKGLSAAHSRTYNTKLTEAFSVSGVLGKKQPGPEQCTQ